MKATCSTSAKPNLPAALWAQAFSAAGPSRRSRPLPADTTSLVVFGLIGLAAVWLVFSVLRKLFGLVLLVALGGGGLLVWNNPALLAGLTDMLASFAGTH